MSIVPGSNLSREKKPHLCSKLKSFLALEVRRIKSFILLFASWVGWGASDKGSGPTEHRGTAVGGSRAAARHWGRAPGFQLPAASPLWLPAIAQHAVRHPSCFLPAQGGSGVYSAYESSSRALTTELSQHKCTLMSLQHAAAAVCASNSVPTAFT